MAMSLGLFKKAPSKEIHRYENVLTSNDKHHERQANCRKYDTDYINVEFDDRNGRRRLVTLGGATRKLEESTRDFEVHASATTDTVHSTDKEIQHNDDSTNGKPNFKKSSKVSKSKSLTRMNRIDSDSSGSEIESSEMSDTKIRELEHYNRLKLNLSCLPHNKKLLKGIRILYSDAVPVENKQQHSLKEALEASKHFKQRQNDHHYSEEPKEIHSPPCKRYKKESHTNSVLSVSGTPIRHPPLFVSSNKSNSKSVKAVEQGVDTPLYVPSKKRSTMAAKRANSFSDIRTKQVAASDFTFLSKSSTDVRLDPTCSPLHENKNTDLQDKQDAMVNRDSYPAPSKPKLEQRMENQMKQSDGETSKWLSVSEKAETFTADVMRPLQDSNQASQLASSRGNIRSGMSECSEIHFIGADEMITFDHNGGQYVVESHDIRITIPKGVVKKHTVAELHIQAILHGPFSFPDAHRPVSPIVRISMNPKVKLKKVIEITLPHFIEKSDQSLAEELTFMKADGAKAATATGEKREKQYQFRQVAGKKQWFGGDIYGTVFTRNSCFFCIVADTTSDSNLTASYCLIPVIPKHISQSTWKIHYYVTYRLKTYTHVRNS